MRAAHVIAGTVANLVVVEANGWTPRDGVLLPLADGEECGPGWGYAEGATPRFVRPEPTEEPVQEPEGGDDGE